MASVRHVRVIVRFFERQIDRAFRYRNDGSVIFQPSWGKAYLVPSPEREKELRDGWRRFTIGAWLFALGCPVLNFSGRLAASWLWTSTGSLSVLKASLIARIFVTLLYFLVLVWWLWLSLRRLTADLQPTTASWIAPAWLRRAALRTTRGGLVLVAATCGLVGVASVIVLISLPSLGRSETLGRSG